MGFLETHNMLQVLRSMSIIAAVIYAFLYILIRRSRVVGKSAYWLRHARLSVRPSVRKYQRGSHWTDFHEI